VRRIQPDLPGDVDSEVQSRLSEIAKLLSAMAVDVQGINRWRYLRSTSGIEELVEAVTFAHYLRHQTLMSFGQTTALLAQFCREGGERGQPAVVALTEEDFLMGVFDLSGEMMRFATTTAALSGALAAAGDGGGRTILADTQALGSFFESLPRQGGGGRAWGSKMEALRTSVKKVERLGYGLAVRGSEKPRGWMPDGDESGPGSPV